MSFSKTVYRRRKLLGISQRSLASQTGLTQATIFKIETGKILRPNKRSITALCNALGLDTNFWLSEFYSFPDSNSLEIPKSDLDFVADSNLIFFMGKTIPIENIPVPELKAITALLEQYY